MAGESERDKLLQATREGRLSLHFVISMPRTRSTALHLALSQGPHINGQICHPMNSGIFAKSQLPEFKFNDFRDTLPDTSLEQAALRINKVAKPLIEQDGKANMIVNEHAKFMTPQHLPFLLEISKTFIFSVRDPRIQFLSHILRVTNECYLTENTKDNKHCFEVEDIIMLLKTYKQSEKELGRSLEELIAQKPIDIFQGDIWHRYTGGHESLAGAPVVRVFVRLLDFVLKEIEATWNNTANTLDYLLSAGRDITVMSVDSEAFVKEPLSVIRRVTSQVKDIGFSEQMITNWSPDTRDKFVCFLYTKEEEKNNAWSGPAINSREVTSEHDSTRGYKLHPALVPEALATLLVKVDMIYKTLLKYS